MPAVRTADTMDVLVLGDSVPDGARTDAAGWPRRLPDRVASSGVDVTVRADMSTELAALADGASIPDEGAVVLVHAGHNDAQLGGGDPRVPEARFRAAAAELDERLAASAAVARHAFVGLVPLLPLEDPEAVPLSDAQPARSLDYDDALATAVETHLPVARPVGAWHDRTADGVHPDDAGHAHVADRVADWLRAA